MATTFNPTVQTRTALTVTGLGTLASATYVASNTIAFNTNDPAEAVIEVEVATTNTPAGNKQVKAFLQVSMDGTNFTTGPTSGTTTTDEPNLIPLGAVPMNSVTTTQRAAFPVAATIGFMPHSAKLVLFNDLGVALTSGAAYVTEISAISN